MEKIILVVPKDKNIAPDSRFTLIHMESINNKFKIIKQEEGITQSHVERMVNSKEPLHLII